MMWYFWCCRCKFWKCKAHDSWELKEGAQRWEKPFNASVFDVDQFLVSMTPKKHKIINQMEQQNIFLQSPETEQNREESESGKMLSDWIINLLHFHLLADVVLTLMLTDTRRGGDEIFPNQSWEVNRCQCTGSAGVLRTGAERSENKRWRWTILRGQSLSIWTTAGAFVVYIHPWFGALLDVSPILGSDWVIIGTLEHSLERPFIR